MAQYPPPPPPPGGFITPPPGPHFSGGSPAPHQGGGGGRGALMVFLVLGVGVLVLVGGAVAGALVWMQSAPSPVPRPVVVTSGGGPTCTKAANCCAKIVSASGNSAEAAKACDGLRKLPDANCAAPLDGYRKSAPLLGVSCD